MLESQRTQTQSKESKKGTQRSKLKSTVISHISNPPEEEFTVDLTLFDEFRGSHNFSKHAALPTSFSNLSNKSCRSRSMLRQRQNVSAAPGG